MQTLLVTGGAGFIGGQFVRDAVDNKLARIVNLDALTYAGNRDSIPSENEHHVFVQGSINDGELLDRLFADYSPDAVVHFAAESHVDRSIDGPGAFIETNINGTYQLLTTTRKHWQGLSGDTKDGFRFLHVSTDEVYGSLGAEGYFTETTPYAPSSPYSASKASSDHLVRAWHHTFGVPTLITNCSNNYGPYQFPEKLIPLVTLNAIGGRPLPVYGDGKNVRDWLYVGDHCSAIRTVLAQGRPGETYNVGGNCERQNIEIVRTICRTVNELCPNLAHECESLITYVTDRPGHDRRYAIDASKIRDELGWDPAHSFESAIVETIQWYLDNSTWVERVLSGEYRMERLGVGE
ncbi:dTDP-glucose 4,6-dehydratase 2 [Stieleria neptunia]|uniref:dTDP-glucose 4,6-dehydratase n=1 Tax=Stieleria neptunia TaxID=2527979 RepID=A0A518HQZ9_9BACT|nr:dTDP-glucose 4,6-dehydratase [Stieleria neptunia]QDV43221.1 dTDP-glucose 4,6-dehydratase 2 [Stieleria neptunia]